MKNIIITSVLALLFLSGCSQYHDPEIAKKISELESKEHLDAFDRQELEDLKQQGSYSRGSLSTKSCNY